jgi:release factor glutamine methyltransferase
VAAGDPHLERGDLRFEPGGALIAEEEGYACLRAIAESAPAHLVSGGWLLLEHGYEQGASCRGLLARAGYVEVFSRQDLADVDRVTGGRLPSLTGGCGQR